MDFRNRFPAKKDLSFPRFVQSGDQFGDRRFSTSGSTHKCHSFSRTDLKIKVFNQWLFQGRITKGNIFQLYRTVQLIVFSILRKFFFLCIRIYRVLHHIFYPLHVAFHFLQFLPGCGKCLQRITECRHKSLKSKQHANGKIPLYHKPCTKRQDHRIGNLLHDQRYHPHVCINFRITDLLRVDRCLKSCPFFKKSIVRTT